VEVTYPHTDFEATARHSAEVDYYALRKKLREERRNAGIDIGEPPRGRAGHYKNWDASDAASAMADNPLRLGIPGLEPGNRGLSGSARCH